MRKLPVDISTFSKIRNLNYLYVDKTEYMYNMITGGQRYFLSRPRRFGKSLLVSTLKEILTDNKQLFDALWISKSDYQWHKHGVIALDFSRLAFDTIDMLENALMYHLHTIAESYGIISTNDTLSSSLFLETVVTKLFEKYGRVAILIDEYDSPILKTLHNNELAKLVRNKIQQFFTTIKGLDAQINFVFITGVSSFAKSGLFSGINNLQVITLRDKYAAICGYTDQEVDHYFADHITHWAHKKQMPYDNLREQIKSWYNGYSFGDNVPKVYNPFSLMNALEIQNFENFWFQSGTPTFLVEILKKEYISFDPEHLHATRDFLGIFDVDTIPLLSLMFQAGYLTIVDYDHDSKLYTLDYPNNEVRTAFQTYLLAVLSHTDTTKAQQLSSQIYIAFNSQNIEKAIELIQQLFAHVPYQLHMKQEKFYHALLIMICLGAGIKHVSEYSTSHGRIDLVLEFTKIIYIIEIKFNDSAEHALEQIKERSYFEQFIKKNKHIILLGLAFKRSPNNFEINYAVEKK